MIANTKSTNNCSKSISKRGSFFISLPAAYIQLLDKKSSSTMAKWWLKAPATILVPIWKWSVCPWHSNRVRYSDPNQCLNFELIDWFIRILWQSSLFECSSEWFCWECHHKISDVFMTDLMVWVTVRLYETSHWLNGSDPRMMLLW